MGRIWMMYVGQKYSGKFVCEDNEVTARQLLFSTYAPAKGISASIVRLVAGPKLIQEQEIPF